MLVKTIHVPSGEKCGWLLRPPPETSFRRPLPSGLMSQISNGPSRSLANAIQSPVGDQSHIVSVHLPSVSCRTTLPSPFITYRFLEPSRPERKTNCLPSGENDGKPLLPACSVNLCRPSPSG